jgi:two-component sensor histidine kinase
MEELVSKLRIAYPLSTTNFKIEIDPILVDSERTKLLGILVVELLTNSIKHNSLKPTILLSIKFENTIYLKLKYSDTGQFNFNTSVLNNTHVSDGLRLIDSIVNHLNGELTIFSNYNYLITIKLDKQSKIYENNKCFNS